MIRPLIITEQLRDPVAGGIGVYIKGLIGGLSELGMMPSTLASRGPSLQSKLPSLRADQVATLLWPHRALVAAWDIGLRIPNSVRKGHDVVHASSLSTPGKSAKPPLSVFIHDVCFLRFPEAYPERGLQWHRRALVNASKRADLILVPSTHVADDLCAYGIGSERIHVTGEGADHRVVEPRAGGGGDFFLSVGTMQPRKNLAVLVAAYEHIRSSLPTPWPLKIVGPSGWGDTSIVPTPGVELLGPVSDETLARLYGEARVFAYVPLDEGFGLPVPEAQRAGVPVVASTGVPSATAHPDACLIVPPTDVDALASALLQAATDETWRAASVVAGYRAITAQTWKHCAVKHVEAWSTCVS
jgi:glycosyltransferase involved in cell wall biosynthesis